MLKINTGSLKEGIKELSKFKAKASYMNLYAAGKNVYITKVCLDDNGLGSTQIAAYKLDGTTDSAKCNFNHQLLDNMLKAMNKINETTIEIEEKSETLMTLTTSKRNLEFRLGPVDKKGNPIPEYKFNGDCMKFKAIETVTIDGAEMQVLLQVTDYAAQDYARPILRGIGFKDNEVAGLDGYRLAVRECSTMQLKNNYVVNSDTLKSVGALIKKDSKIAVAFNDKRCKISIGDLTVYSDLLEGNFINYKSLIPTEALVTATFDKTELKEEIDFMLSLAADKPRSLVKVIMENKKISIKSSDIEAKSTIKLDKASFKGTDLEIAFNTSYVEAMLKHFTGKITCKFTSNFSPIVCTSKEIKGLDLLLPVRLFK